MKGNLEEIKDIIDCDRPPIAQPVAFEGEEC